MRQPVVVLLGALLAGCYSGSFPSLPEAVRGVSVIGQGEVQTLPDRATVNFAVEQRGKQVPPAQQRAGETTAALLELCQKLGIGEEHVSTSQLVIQSNYRWDQGKREFVDYIVTRHMTVELRELEKLGALLEGAVALGINNVSPPQLGSSRAAELELEALRLAADNARDKARALAQQLDAKLGAVRRLDAGSGGVYPPPRPQRMHLASAADATDAAQTYSSGLITFSATVNAEFDLDAN